MRCVWERACRYLFESAPRGLPGGVASGLDRRKAGRKGVVQQLLQDGSHVGGERLPRAHVHRGFVHTAGVRHVGRLEKAEKAEGGWREVRRD